MFCLLINKKKSHSSTYTEITGFKKNDNIGS